MEMASELEDLCRALDGLRASVLSKLSGLSEDDARRSTVPSGTNVAGVVQHLGPRRQRLPPPRRHDDERRPRHDDHHDERPASRRAQVLPQPGESGERPARRKHQGEVN
jgi:hypothetical protein